MKLFTEEYLRRERWFRYTINPWASLPALVTAVILTAIYHPPLVATTVIVTGTFVGGMGTAYGPLSRHRWMEKYGFVVAFLASVLTATSYHLSFASGLGFAMLAWTICGITTPFWIWRKQGLKTFAHADASKPGWQLH